MRFPFLWIDKVGSESTISPITHSVKKLMPLHAFLRRASQGSPETKISEGDIVLILVGFSTGNTDYHESSPFGSMPGGYIIASMISSMVENQWIDTIEGMPILILILAIMGTLLGIHGSVTVFWFGVCIITTIYFIVTHVLFSYFSIEIPWFMPNLAFCATALLYFTHNRLQEEVKLISLERNYFEEKARRAEESTKLAKLEGYLSLGKAVQQLLLPKDMSGRFGNYQYNLLYTPHLKMAGDWFYVWKVSEDEIRFFIGDIMGKGPSAAIPVASTVGILKECERQRLSTMDSLKKINDHLIDLYDFNITCTIASATIFGDGNCELINTGSPGWFLHSKEKNRFLLCSVEILWD